MNFQWTKIAERGQYEIGFIDVFQLNKKQKAISIIHYLPQHTDKQQRVVFTLILEGDKKDWTDGTIDRIMHDAELQIKNSEYFKFNNLNSLEYMNTQIFTIKTIENFNYLNHGDFSFISE